MAVILEIQSAALPNQEGYSEGRLVAGLPGVKLLCTERHRSLEFLSITSISGRGGGAV